MNILKLSPYFLPERVSGTHLCEDINNSLHTYGVHIVNFVPSPSRGISREVNKEYKNKRIESLFDGMYYVVRFPMFREGRNPIQRAIRYLLVNIRQYQLSSKSKDIDIIVEGSTPPTQGLLCSLVKRKLSKKAHRKVAFVYHLQDIFPDSLVNAGMTKKGSFLWKIGRKIENYTYSHADKIIVISEGFKRNIMSKGVPEERIVVISNWVDLNNVVPIDRQDNKLFDEYGIDRSKFIVVYAGNTGETQGAGIIVDVAKKMIHNTDVQFVIFGGGAKFHEIKERIETEKINNIFITGLQPQERVSEVYSMGNVALITCKPGTGSAGLPSKIWSIMACNTPIIASFDLVSDLADIIHDSGAGSCVEPGNVLALVTAIQEALSNWKQGKTNRIDIRSYAMKTASKDSCLQRYFDTLFNTMKEIGDTKQIKQTISKQARRDFQ